MPPWNNMTPQQLQQLYMMFMNRGTAGMQQPGMGNLSNALLAQQMGGQVPGGMGAAQGGGVAQNPALMQYLMGLGGGAASSPTLAQLLAMRQQQQGGGPGNSPQGGGGLTLADLLGVRGQQASGYGSLPSLWRLPSPLANESLGM